MKKLTLALVVSTVAVSAASANHINTGFYAGAAVGYGATTGKATFQSRGAGTVGSVDVGSGGGNIGIHGGYGYVTGCLYVGGEVAYTFESTKINNSLGGPGNTQLKRNGYFNAALRGGYLFTPSTMGYIRLGGNWGQWKLNDNNNGGFTNFDSSNAGSGSKNRLSFAPGVGVETAVHRNVYLRVEYTYEFGPSVRATNPNLPGTFTNIGTLRSQSGKVGLSYKF